MSKKPKLRAYKAPTLAPERPRPPANKSGLVVHSMPGIEESDMTLAGACELARESIKSLEAVPEWLDYILEVHAYHNAQEEKE